MQCVDNRGLFKFTSFLVEIILDLQFQSMGMNAVYSIFAFLIGAFFLCLLLSIVEHIFKWFRNTNMETETDKSD